MNDIKTDTKVEPVIEASQAPSNIKVGDAEYSQEELSRLVGLGKTAVELEEKWNTPIDSLNSAFTKTSTELKQIKEEQERQKLLETQRKANEGEQLSPEEQETLVRKELGKYGVVTKDEANTLVNQAVSQYMEGQKLLSEVSGIISSAEAEGKPKVTAEELLLHMQETGIKSPAKAYKDKFEDVLDKMKEEKLKGIKPQGLYTTQASTAGAKAPQPVSLTKENLSQQLADFFRSRGQA